MSASTSVADGAAGGRAVDSPAVTTGLETITIGSAPSS